MPLLTPFGCVPPLGAADGRNTGCGDYCGRQTFRWDNGPQGFGDNAPPGTSTQWPSQLNLAATFDPSLAYEFGVAMGVAAATPSLKYLDPGAPSFTLRPYLLALTIRIRMGTWSVGCVTDEGGGIGFAQGPSYLTLTPTNADHAGACEPALRTLTHSFSALSLLGAAAAVTAALPPVSAGVVIAVPLCVNIEMAPGQTSWDISPPIAPGRLCMACVQVAGPGWLLFFGMCLCTGKPLAHPLNAAIISQASSWITRLTNVHQLRLVASFSANLFNGRSRCTTVIHHLFK